MFTPAKLSVNRALIKGDARGRTVEQADKMVFAWSAINAPGARQAAYHLTLYSDALIFDSGWVESDEQECALDGKILPEGKKIFAEIEIRDDLGNASCVLKEYFYNGSVDWSAGWISMDSDPDGATVYARREFTINKPVNSAGIYACGLGYHELSINGNKIGKAYLDPAHTDYTKQVQYVFYPEIEKQLNPGANAIGVRVGGGWRDNYTGMIRDLEVPVRFFGKRELSLIMKIEYEDGTSEEIVTDSSWQAGKGASVQSNLFDGEIYDANCARPGWNKPGFTGFANAVPACAPGGEMRVMTLPPIKEMGIFKPLSVSHPAPGVSVVDFGQNLSGVIRMKLSNLEKGRKIRVVHAEELDEDGLL